MHKSISVVVPSYNEGKTIKKNIQKIYKYLNSLNLDSFEIIAVNDGSKDSTLSELNSIKDKIKELKILDNGQNRGKGFTVKHGVLKANSDIICFTDADLSTPIEEIEKAIDLFNNKKVDLVIGSRSEKLGANLKIKQPFYRQLMGKIFSFLANYIVPLGGIEDTQCGFKCFTREAAFTIFPKQHMERFSFDVELLYLAKLNQYKIENLPVTWINSEESTVNPIKDSIRMFFDLLKIRKIHRGCKERRS